MFGPWTPFTPVISNTGGVGPPICTTVARYRQVGHTVNVSYNIKINNVNGATGALTAQLPVSPGLPVTTLALMSQEVDLTGFTGFGLIRAGNPLLSIGRYDNAGTTITLNYRYVVSGTYEV
jgi:hypothetical protein